MQGEGNSMSNTHITHIEDLVFSQGNLGVVKTIHFLEQLVNIVSGNKSECEITTKWDGSPSIICGEKNGFFVGTKSVFNKVPKLNYTNEDIDKNHHDPHLNIILKTALKHLPELNMKGIYQGDLLYTWHDTHLQKIEGVQYLTFKPNTITYAVPIVLQIAKRMMESRIGVIFHTRYDENLTESDYVLNIGSFELSDNVWFRDASFCTSGNLLNEEDNWSLHHLLQIINENYKECPTAVKNKFVASKTISELTNLYINDCIRKDLIPSAGGLENFVIERENERILQAKKQETAINRMEEKKELLRFFNQKHENIQYLFNAFFNIATLKQICINNLTTVNASIETFLEDKNGVLKPTTPEGFVLIDKATNDIVKIVNRYEFSLANFNNKDWK